MPDTIFYQITCFLENAKRMARTAEVVPFVIVVILIITLAIVFLPRSPATQMSREVIVYTSVDQVYSEPVFHEFENQTGIKVLPVYDVEATKTTGLVNRLIAEKNRPQADVFWSAEFGQTILLKNQNILSPYMTPSGSDIPRQYKDPEGYWTGFGGRARVFIINTDRLTTDQYPHSIYDMLDSEYTGNSMGIAYPMFGTTSTQAAALYSLLGTEKAKSFYTRLYERGVRVVDGNSVVRDLVASGQLSFGLTDTDDACGAIERGDHVAIVIPDQQDSDIGTLFIPDTVALIAGSPHPDEAKVFIDYVLSCPTEESLFLAGWLQIPSRNISVPTPCINTTAIKLMNVSYQDVYLGFEPARKDLIEIFIR
jgi:iron(III) transport system substrate-binding protein